MDTQRSQDATQSRTPPVSQDPELEPTAPLKRRKREPGFPPAPRHEQAQSGSYHEWLADGHSHERYEVLFQYAMERSQGQVCIAGWIETKEENDLSWEVSNAEFVTACLFLKLFQPQQVAHQNFTSEDVRRVIGAFGRRYRTAELPLATQVSHGVTILAVVAMGFGPRNLWSPGVGAVSTRIPVDAYGVARCLCME